MSRWKTILVFALGAALLELGSNRALACAACFGQSDSSMARGMNMGIFAMLMVITTVLCGVAGFFVYVARRTSQIEDSAAHPNLSEPQTNA